MARNDKEIQQQIQVLATNLEILNQKLNQDPDALVSPGEQAIKDSMEEMQSKMEYLQNLLKTTQLESSMKKEKEDLKKEVVKFNRIVSNLNKFDKDWMADLLANINKVNLSSNKLAAGIEKFSAETEQLVNNQRAEITKSIYHRLYKSLKRDNMIMMGVTVFMSSSIALVILLGMLYMIQL